MGTSVDKEASDDKQVLRFKSSRGTNKKEV